MTHFAFRSPRSEAQFARVSSLVGVVLVIAIGCGKGKPLPGAGGPPAMPVQMQVAQPTNVEDTSEFVATLKSRNSTTISPLVDGVITKIFVKSGDRVDAGTALMQIDPLKQQATVGSQEGARAAQLANLRYAREQYQRTSKLFADGVVSKQELDSAQSALDAAQEQLNALDANVREQQVQLRYYKVDASADGVVGDIPVHVGDHVTPATVLTTVDQPGKVEAYISVPVEHAPDLKMGLPVRMLGSDGKPVADGHVSFISPRVDDQTQTILVKALMDDSKYPLRTQQFARTQVVWRSHPGVTIPVLAVSRVNGQYFAFFAEGKDGSMVAHQRQLQLGDIVGNDYVVESGMKPGDKLITSVLQFLADGAPVTPKA